MQRRIHKRPAEMNACTPSDSLPRYGDSTAGAKPGLSREEEAELALTNTAFTPGSRGLLIALFLITIAIVPVMQLVVEIQAPRAPGRFSILRCLDIMPGLERVRTAGGLFELWNLIPHAADLKAAQTRLQDDSVVSQWLRPRVELILSGALGAGNEQVCIGKDPWLFYRPDVDYIIGPPFLSPEHMKRRSQSGKVQADPVMAITQFRDQLAARDIHLIILPIPVKASVEGDKLATRAKSGVILQNPSFAEFKRRLEKSHITVFDPQILLMQLKAASGNGDLYLQGDTHWRPETMEAVAGNLAAFIQMPASRKDESLHFVPKEIGGFGDIAAMLNLPATQNVRFTQKVVVHQAVTRDGKWNSTRGAEILLLGDSFLNVFSSTALGWGDSAGFAEQLSGALQGSPIDCIIRNNDGAFATRESLRRDLARDKGRLDGTRLVIWEFAERELAFGDWKEVVLDSERLTP